VNASGDSFERWILADTCLTYGEWLECPEVGIHPASAVLASGYHPFTTILASGLAALRATVPPVMPPVVSPVVTRQGGITLTDYTETKPLLTD